MAEHSAEGVQVLVVADPGLPTRRADAVKEDLEQILRDLFSPPIRVLTRTRLIRIDPQNSLDFADARRMADEHDRVDVTVLLTEIPRHTDGKPLMAEIFPEENVAVLSCPTFGAWATKKRILTTMVDSVIRLSPTTDSRDPEVYGLRWSQWSEHAETGSLALHAHTFTGGPRTVLGMTLGNDPWRIAPRLSSAMAAALATGAFGIFYHSIWEMSDSLSTMRLLSIGVLAMTAMGVWLMIGNRLWDKPKEKKFSRVVMLYNISTVLTLSLCMLMLYLCLVVLILLGGLVVIDPGFMSEILEDDAEFSNYLDIAWLSAAMGTVAGALGSSFDSETDLRKLTHGQRERQRQYSESYTRDRRDDYTDDYINGHSDDHSEDSADQERPHRA